MMNKERYKPSDDKKDSRRSDFEITEDFRKKIKKFPTEVYEFSEVLGLWGAKSWYSKLIID